LLRGVFRLPGERVFPWLEANVGFGQGVRFRFGPRPGLGRPSSDTMIAGPLVFGPGAGVLVPIARNLALTGSCGALFGGPRFGVVIEAALGGRVSF
jgi:hypothetical protein